MISENTFDENQSGLVHSGRKQCNSVNHLYMIKLLMNYLDIIIKIKGLMGACTNITNSYDEIKDELMESSTILHTTKTEYRMH